MIRFIALLTVVLGMGLSTFAQEKKPATAVPPAKPAATPAKSGETPAVNFNAVSFKDAIEFVADASGANIVVNWKTLEKAGVTPDTPISMKMGGITLRKLLDLILKQAAADDALTWMVEDGVIEITTRAAEEERLVTRVYGIQDLLFTAPDFTDAPTFSLENTGSSSGGGGGRSGGGRSGGGRSGGGSSGSSSLFGNSNASTSNANSKTELSQKERADEIIKMITTTIRPEIWVDNGGTSKISYFRGNLIITAPRSVHKLIGG